MPEKAASDKTARDRASNEELRDIYIRTSQQPWLPFRPASTTRCRHRRAQE